MATSPSASPTPRPRLISRPSLLPAFEPLSSSPTALPRPPKRNYDGSPTGTRSRHLPTPAPTSSTNLVASSSSSPPHQHQHQPSRQLLTRPGFVRTDSTVSARVPLCDVRSASLKPDGEPTLFGRSSNSSHFQLSANRHISRVHVEARYEAPSPGHAHGQVVIKCLGWNGARVHCQGQSFELAKLDSFTSDKPRAEIILDVQDARVLVRWPLLQTDRAMSTFSESTALADDSPTHTPRQPIPSSPPMLAQMHSPVSPSPGHLAAMSASQTFIHLAHDERPSIEVYEDGGSGDDEQQQQQKQQHAAPQEQATSVSHEQQQQQQQQHPRPSLEKRHSGASSVLSSVHEDDLSDNDEENDPIIHSFGPFGANLSARIASFGTSSPERRRREPLKAATVAPAQRQMAAGSSPVKVASKDLSKDTSPIRNHVINQLAYSRLQSMPLSSIFNNLPAMWTCRADGADSHDASSPAGVAARLTQHELKMLLEETAAVGEIARSGKDAAGKALENEFYYVPELDTDEMRKTAVASSLGKPGMRAARKQHKQYYWKRPRF